MATLSALASILAERAGKKRDVSFIEEMKDLVVIVRARMLANTLSKNPANAKYYLCRPFLMEVEQVDSTNECATIDSTTDKCDIIFRTKLTLPPPLRYSPNPLAFVGTPGGNESFAWTTNGYNRFLQENKLVGRKTRYNYAGDYIYLYNYKEESGSKIQVQDVFPDPRLLAPFFCDTDGTIACWQDEIDSIIDEQTGRLILQDIMNGDLRFPGNNAPIEIKEDKNV